MSEQLIASIILLMTRIRQNCSIIMQNSPTIQDEDSGQKIVNERTDLILNSLTHFLAAEISTETQT